MGGSDKPKVLAIGGPTASGKTSLSVTLAKRLNGEVVCVDSMQIYCGLDVGTAKVTEEEMQGVPHHLVGFLAPEETFSVADFVALADRCIRDISARGKLPVLVGGTGLYMESLLSGVRFAEQKTDPAVRRQLEEQAAQLGADAMHEKLAQIDPEYAATVHPNNVGRVLRALELFQITGVTMTRQRAESKPSEPPYDSLLFCIGFEDRSVLYQRIDRRVDLMLEQGILREARLVYDHRDTYHTAAQAIGYKEFFPYFCGESPLEPCVDKLKQASRNYAKRQLTWFRRMPQTLWLDGIQGNLEAQALAHIHAHWPQVEPGVCEPLNP